MVYHCPSVSHVALYLKNPLANSLQISQSYWNWWSLWWNFDFSFKSYGKESLYKYCMNVDDGHIMRSWRSCLFILVILDCLIIVTELVNCKNIFYLYGMLTLVFPDKGNILFFCLQNVINEFKRKIHLYCYM